MPGGSGGHTIVSSVRHSFSPATISYGGTSQIQIVIQTDALPIASGSAFFSLSLSGMTLPASIAEEMRRRAHTGEHVVPRCGHAPMLMGGAQVGAIRHFLLNG